MKFSFGICVLLLFAESLIDGLELTILHGNDIHGNFAGDEGYGGFPKLIHMIKKIKAEATKDKPVIYVFAGDIFSGSVWYSIHRVNISADFIKLLHPDALALGNHEFDEGVQGLEQYASKIGVPILCANGDFSGEPGIGQYVRSSLVFTPENTDVKVGVIGYINKSTRQLANTGKITFSDDVKAVQLEAQKLRQQGIKIIIGLGHSGFESDKKIAELVPDIDVVVGGHSHTMLYSGRIPARDKVDGDYPTVVKNKLGHNVPVVQIGIGGKFLGKLVVKFDDNGNVTGYHGKPIVLDSSVAKDEEASERLDFYRPAVDKMLKDAIGTSRVYLQGGQSCRRQECNFANLITDAFCEYKADIYEGPSWTDAPICVINSGAIRTSVNASKQDGNITTADLYGALPYANKLVTLDLNTSSILEMLEVSVRSDGETSFGEFLQFSGIHVVYDMVQPKYQRVKEVLVRCSKCDTPKLEPIKPKTVYKLVTTEYLSKGSDGFSMLKESYLHKRVLERSDFDVLKMYIEFYGVVQTNVENRIVMELNVQAKMSSRGIATYPCSLFVFFIVVIKLYKWFL